MIDAAIDQRRQFFEAKRDSLYRVEIFYAIVLEGQRSKTGIMAALKRLPSDPRGGMNELKAQFTGDAMKVLLRAQIDADLLKLEGRVQNFCQQLSDFMQIEVLDQQGQFTFLRRLLNFDEWRIAGKPKTTQFLDYQVVNSDVAAERDHLRIGDQSSSTPALPMSRSLGPPTMPISTPTTRAVSANASATTLQRTRQSILNRPRSGISAKD